LTNHHYDTVAFDVRDSTFMLMFARTSDEGQIDDYFLLMRTIQDDFEDVLTVEVNSKQHSGNGLIEAATLAGNTLNLRFGDKGSGWGGEPEITLSFEETDDNFKSVESGMHRVLGDRITGGSS
jgi:hypothetical protein